MVEIACVASPHRWERDWGGTTRRDPSRGNGLTDRPKPNLARSPGSRQHRSMASSPSAAFLRLRHYIAERMRMSPIDQPLMLIELLGRRSPAPAQDVAPRIRNGWWARFTFNGISRCEMGTVALDGGEELSAAEGGICWQ